MIIISININNYINEYRWFYRNCSAARKPLSRKDRNLLNVLFLVTLFFLLFNSPQLIRVARGYVWKGGKDARTKANDYLAFQITNNLSNVNYAINFFLYFLSGKKFRSDLRMLLKCKYWRMPSRELISSM